VLSNGFDGAGAVRTGDSVVFLREGVFAHWDDEVAVVKGSGVNWYLLV
jgi:hypothetical protein